MDALLALASHDLRELADAIRGGRVTSPFNKMAVQRVVSATPEEVTDALRRLDAAETPAGVVAAMLDAMVQDREQRPRAEEAFDLVTTGPEAGGVTNRDTRIVVRQMFSSAAESVLVVGYAVYQGKQIFEALAQRMEAVPTLRVRMCLDVQRRRTDSSRTDDVLRRFAKRFRETEWPGTALPAVFHDPRSLDLDESKRSSLHGKCVVVDRRVAFVSSANFTEAAQIRNIEIGVLIRSAPFAARLADHFDALVASDVLKRVPGL